MNNKKGVELSMNLIIIAAIGLLILVILAVLVINSGGKAQNATDACNLHGGVCRTSCGDSSPLSGDYTCASGQECCELLKITA